MTDDKQQCVVLLAAVRQRLADGHVSVALMLAQTQSVSVRGLTRRARWSGTLCGR